MRKLALLSAFVLIAAPAFADGQPNQLSTIYSVFGGGFGPQSLGVAPGRTMFSLYGTMDMGLNYMSSNAGSVTRMQSGNAWTSKLGFYAQEDLGDGLTAFARLESGLTANNGAFQDANSTFNRGSYVGLYSPRYGQWMFGRTYTSLGVAAIGADVFLGNGHESVYSYFLTTSGLGGPGNADAPARLNQTVRYSSPRIAGRFGLDASLSFKKDQSVGPSVHAQTVAFNYADSSTVAWVGYGQSWCDAGLPGSCTGNDPKTPAVRTDTFIASLTQDFGAFVGLAAYIRFDPKAPGAATAQLFTLGVQKMSGTNLYRASIAYRDTSIEKNHAYGATLGVDHFLSKRTALYVRASVLKNGPASSLIYNYDSTSGNLAVKPGQTIRDATLGIYHHF